MGKTTQRRLQAIGLVTVGDLLLHLPFRHESPSDIRSIASLAVGEETVLRARVLSVASRETTRRRVKVLEALVSDETGSVLAVWYNQPYLEAAFHDRPEVLLKGALVRQRGATHFLVRRHEILSDSGESLHILGLVPVYPSTADLSVRTLRNLVHEAVPRARDLVDPLPARMLSERRYPGKAEAVLVSHFPGTQGEARRARDRLAFEELLLLQTAILRRRFRQESARAARPLHPAGDLTRRYLHSLPFQPTNAQRRAIAEIDADLGRPIPMRRLLHGDVGSGKTMVATYTVLRAIEQGGQAVLMAPTEVLADQHYLELSRRLEPLGVDVRLLKGSQPTGEKRAVADAAATGRAALIVGTHALIQEGVRFHELRVAVVDEQHRFGVRQRDAMLAADTQGLWPHSLHMSATPIPRTLSLTLYGDLDVSTLDEMPPGRTPVTTRLVFPGSEDKMWSFVRQQLDQGRQAYVVCPLIEESDSLEAVSARQMYVCLADGELAGYRLRLLYGSLRPAEKAEAMADYSAGRADALVSTTVIEVGVDVPNATVMVIMGARRFGLSQLHQLRGRVGRGGGAAYCFVMIDTEDETVQERMAIFARTNDGFALAEADLAARGEGQLFGERQSGIGDLQVASLLRDRRLLEQARATAAQICGRTDTDLPGPLYRLLLEAAEERFAAKVDWVDRV
ncbi:MAG: ATP-dependent DNA helicase RecG [Actinobacteria bacterium]|nr:ATP-dependent DNA helicase RecG [Actinomycetota bacterium]